MQKSWKLISNSRTFVPDTDKTRTPVQMGATHTDMDNTDTRTRTVKEYAEQTGQNPDSVRVRASRKLGRPVGQLSALTPDEWAQVYGTKAVQKTKPIPPKQKQSVLDHPPVVANVPPPGNTKSEKSAPFDWLLFFADVRAFTVDALLISLAIGHAALIWYELATTYGMYGTIGGGVVFGFIVAAVLLAADRTKNITSETALYFALVIDVAAMFLHYEKFKGFGAPTENTVVICFFIGAMSWGALYLYRHQKNN